MTIFKRQLVPGEYLTAVDMLHVLSQRQLTAAAVDGCVLLAAEPAIAWLLDSCCIGTLLGESHMHAPAETNSMHAFESHCKGVAQEAAADGDAAALMMDCSTAAAAAGSSLHSKVLQVAAAAGVNRAPEQLQQHYLEHHQQVLSRKQRRAKRLTATSRTSPTENSGSVTTGIAPPPADNGAAVIAESCTGAPMPGTAVLANATAEAAAAADAAWAPGHQGQRCHQCSDMEPTAVHIVQLDPPEAFFLLHVLNCCTIYGTQQAAGGPIHSSAGQLQQSVLGHLQGCEQVQQDAGQPCLQQAVQELTVQQFWCWCCGTAESPLVFVSQYAAYNHFRNKGWLPRPGLSYGADYVLYQLHPEHAHSNYVVSILVEKSCGEFEAATKASAGEQALQQRTADLDKCRGVIAERQHTVQQGCIDGQDGADARAGLSWLDAHILQRLARQVLKQLLLLYVVIPDGLQLHNPECVQQLAVREVLVRRWVPAEHRGDGK